MKLKLFFQFLCLQITIQYSNTSFFDSTRRHFKNVKLHTNNNQTSTINNISKISDKSFNATAPRRQNNIFDKNSTSQSLLTCEDCPRQAVCVPYVQCPAHVRDFHRKQQIECHLTKTNQIGICCSTGKNFTDFHEFKKLRTARSTLGIKNVRSIVELSSEEFKAWKNKENFVQNHNEAIVQEGTPSYGHNRIYKSAHQSELSNVVRLANKALEIALATKALKKREAISNEDIELDVANNIETPFNENCLPFVKCDFINSPYRTVDGSCNNVAKPSLGLLSSPFSRLLPPAYDDGIWSPRVSSISGEPLPSARVISSNLFRDDRENRDGLHSLLLMQFGQFLSHDFTKAFHSTFENGSGIECCSSDRRRELREELQHPACMPIKIDNDDVFFKHFGIKCMNFVRSFITPRSDCTMGYSQQMNTVTHFIDGSMIYGSDHSTFNDLREFQGGRLRVFHDFGRQLLPLSNDSHGCIIMEKGAACFAGGDTRCNQFILLTALHTLFVREHNRIADELAFMNLNWDDETVFQETRRIVIAELQHITYNEWLPEIIGEEAMADFDLRVRPEYSSDYNPNSDPSILNEFSTAAFRLHSLVDSKIEIYEDNDDMEEMIEISDVMELPSKLRKRKFFDSVLNAMTHQNMQKFDRNFAEGLTRYMFRGGNPFGLDVTSMNIQRGRDHGLRPYNDYRQLVGLPRVDSWDYFDPEIADILSKLYQTPDDIDLFVGGILEPPEFGSIVGKTFRDIIAEQFSRLRQGDRYFYEHNPNINPGYFTREQLREIKKVTMSRLICDNSDHILMKKQTSNAFLIPNQM
ncbi:chorion peroxidase isoform X2 [Chrysoperla carnea]|uniref:chorion peroxidase isoform X2 n=1 Tax=Chrysoperla carnea TaxID=189513 RepID=UPI001D06F22A|nr:chorion peroxidase isoform X2 [Chrysoperla carnea]